MLQLEHTVEYIADGALFAQTAHSADQTGDDGQVVGDLVVGGGHIIEQVNDGVEPVVHKDVYKAVQNLGRLAAVCQVLKVNQRLVVEKLFVANGIALNLVITIRPVGSLLGVVSALYIIFGNEVLAHNVQNFGQGNEEVVDAVVVNGALFLGHGATLGVFFTIGSHILIHSSGEEGGQLGHSLIHGSGTVAGELQCIGNAGCLGTLQRLIGCIDVQDHRGLGVIVLAGGGVTIHLADDHIFAVGILAILNTADVVVCKVIVGIADQPVHQGGQNLVQIPAQAGAAGTLAVLIH